jgi:hypothetical protein
MEQTVPTAEAASQPILVAIMSLFTAHHGHSKDASTLAIAGAATPNVAPAVFYSFTPEVTQSDGRTLRFSIKNKPSWASFGKKHGTLYGVPQMANSGSYPNIVITVSDGVKTVELPPFSIRVAAPVVAATQ